LSTTARLFFADSERDADLYYLTGFLAGDPFLCLVHDGKTTLFLGDLEVDRARRQGRADEVVRVKEVADALEKEIGRELPGDRIAWLTLVTGRIARDRGIDAFEVPAAFSVAFADGLRGAGLGVHWRPSPFLPERARKTADEVAKVRGAIEHTEAAMTAAIDRLRAAQIRDGMLFENGKPLTAESVRFGINLLLLERNCHPYEVIVAGGEQAVDPHERGHGHLPANVPIILDIFPRDNATRYHGDMTRTVVRGRASDDAKRLFDTVAQAKANAEAMLKPGVDGRDVHERVKRTFEEAGYETGVRGGRMVGFFHGTGHGLGLEVHEYPRVSTVHEEMLPGHVVTIEPGLYYPGIGGVRIEDDVLVTDTGCENLCTLDAFLEI
jgi:Xaa-Pro aminopeptidase